MISAEKANELVLSTSRTWATKRIKLTDAIGRVTAESIFADRDFPPFDRVCMDGIAIEASSFQAFDQGFKVEQMQAAGMPKQRLKDTKYCIEVMTGAILPEFTDAVIRYEDLEKEDDVFKIQLASVLKNQNVHKKGSDWSKGLEMIKKGSAIGPAEIAILATVGKSELEVFEPPGCAVISSGEELVDIDQTPLEHQIRKSNHLCIAAALDPFHITCNFFHINDNENESKEALAEILAAHPLVLISGGVSKGKFDFIHTNLEALGVKKMFHRVAQRPGKPFWFGTHEKGNTVFAFPGNPLSTQTCVIKYLIPYIQKCLTIEPKIKFAQLSENFQFSPSLDYFLPVKIDIDPTGQLQAKPHTGNGSGDLTNLLHVDGFLQLPANRSEFMAGESLPLLSFRAI